MLSKVTYSLSTRLVDWMMLPCTWWRTPAGLTISPQSWATKTLSTLITPVSRSTVTSQIQVAQAAP